MRRHGESEALTPGDCCRKMHLHLFSNNAGALPVIFGATANKSEKMSCDADSAMKWV